MCNDPVKHAGQQLWSRWEGQLTLTHFSLASLDKAVNQNSAHTFACN